MKKTMAALTTAVFVSGCSTSVNWPETGIWSCENKLDSREITFDTRNDYKAIISLTDVFLIVKDLNSDVNVQISNDQGWICEMPSGKEYRFDSDLG